MEGCPIIQTLAVFAFAIGLVLHSIIFFAIRRCISREYREYLELEENKFKSIVLDFPAFIPSKQLSLVGRFMKWVALVSLLSFVSSAIYIGYLKSYKMSLNRKFSTLCAITDIFCSTPF